MLGITPLESPTSGSLGCKVTFSSFLRSVIGYCINHYLTPLADSRNLTAHNVRSGEWFTNNSRPSNHITPLQLFSLVFSDLCLSILHIVQSDDPFGLQGA